MRRVIIESPYKGDVKRNLRFLQACMRDCLYRGEAPYASHALYTQPGVLDDDRPEERKLGMEAGFAWHTVADAVIVYLDLGVSDGMLKGVLSALVAGKPVETRILRGHAPTGENERILAALLKLWGQK